MRKYTIVFLIIKKRLLNLSQKLKLINHLSKVQHITSENVEHYCMFPKHPRSLSDHGYNA